MLLVKDKDVHAKLMARWLDLQAYNLIFTDKGHILWGSIIVTWENTASS